MTNGAADSEGRRTAGHKPAVHPLMELAQQRPHDWFALGAAAFSHLPWRGEVDRLCHPQCSEAGPDDDDAAAWPAGTTRMKRLRSTLPE